MLQLNCCILILLQSSLMLLLILLNELPVCRLIQAAEFTSVLGRDRLAQFSLPEFVVQLAKLQKVEDICLPKHSYELGMKLAVVLSVEDVDAAVPAERLLVGLAASNAAVRHELLPKRLDKEILVVQVPGDPFTEQVRQRTVLLVERLERLFRHPLASVQLLQQERFALRHYTRVLEEENAESLAKEFAEHLEEDDLVVAEVCCQRLLHSNESALHVLQVVLGAWFTRLAFLYHAIEQDVEREEKARCGDVGLEVAAKEAVYEGQLGQIISEHLELIKELRCRLHDTGLHVRRSLCQVSSGNLVHLLVDVFAREEFNLRHLDEQHDKVQVVGQLVLVVEDLSELCLLREELFHLILVIAEDRLGFLQRKRFNHDVLRGHEETCDGCQL